jgi:hypothetical protein
MALSEPGFAGGDRETFQKKEDQMSLQSFYPVLMTEDVEASVRFYTEHMGFVPTFEGDWYVSLKHRENPAYELAVLQRDHGTIPEGFRGRSSSLVDFIWSFSYTFWPRKAKTS